MIEALNRGFQIPTDNLYGYLDIEDINLPEETDSSGPESVATPPLSCEKITPITADPICEQVTAVATSRIQYQKPDLLLIRNCPGSDPDKLDPEIRAQIARFKVKKRSSFKSHIETAARKVIRSLPTDDSKALEARRSFSSQDVRFCPEHQHFRSSSSRAGDSRSNRSGSLWYNHSRGGASKKN